jgi:hypothetical protein
MTDITERLRELSKARWDKDAWERETTVRIPAEPDRDIDLVLSNAAAEIDRLRARVAELEAQERGGWIRTSGWSNELYSFDRSDNEDGTFALTVSERDGERLVEIDRLTASDLERIVEIVGDEEIARLLQCERRLAAVARWLEANQPDVFRRGLWDAINEA